MKSNTLVKPTVMIHIYIDVVTEQCIRESQFIEFLEKLDQIASSMIGIKHASVGPSKPSEHKNKRSTDTPKE